MVEPVAPYTLGRLLRESRKQLPFVLRNARRIPSGFKGPDRLDGKTRILMQLRMARLMGCPVCVNLFPPVARRAGLSSTAIASALAGLSDELTPEQHAAVVWAGALIDGGGEEPESIPAPATLLGADTRAHLAVVVRLDLVVHATGLMFLPHRWIESAAR